MESRRDVIQGFNTSLQTISIRLVGDFSVVSQVVMEHSQALDSLSGKVDVRESKMNVVQIIGDALVKDNNVFRRMEHLENQV